MYQNAFNIQAPRKDTNNKQLPNVPDFLKKNTYSGGSHAVGN